MDEELLERKLLQRKRIRGLLILLDLLLLALLVYDIVMLVDIIKPDYHTVNLATVMTPVALPENIKEYEIPTA